MAALKSAVDTRAPILIIDVREPEEYAAGHVPAAINIPRGVIEFQIWTRVGYPDMTDMQQKMYLYCGSGARCALAAKSLQGLGFTQVYAVDMTLKAWSAAGYALER